MLVSHQQQGASLWVCSAILFCCIVCLLGIAIPGSPLFAMHSRFGRCGIFPLIFWDRCGIFPVRNFPLRKKPRTEFPPPRYFLKSLFFAGHGVGGEVQLLQPNEFLLLLLSDPRTSRSFCPKSPRAPS